jgi:hypothetical protein
LCTNWLCSIGMISGLICAWGSKPLSAPPENYDQASSM